MDSLPVCDYCGLCDVQRERDHEELLAAREVVKAARTMMEKGDSVVAHGMGVHADFRAALTAYDIVKDRA